MKEQVSFGGRLFEENGGKEIPIDKGNLSRIYGYLGEVKKTDGDKAIVRVNAFKREVGHTATQSAFEYAKIGNELFKELSDKYHIRQPDTMFFVGKDAEEKTSAYTAVNKIDGIELEPSIIDLISSSLAVEEENILLAELDNLLASLSDYYCDVISAYDDGGKRYLWDIGHLRQYMFGKQKGDKVNHIYLIDFDPFFIEATSENSLDCINKFMYWMRLILAEEEKIGYQLVEARKHAVDNINKLLNLKGADGNNPLDPYYIQTLQLLLDRIRVSK